VLEFIKAKSDAKSCLAKKSRKREDSDGFTKEIPPLQKRRRSGRKRQNQTIHNSVDLSGEGNSLLFITTDTPESSCLVREEVVSSGMGKADAIG
jgi:hypothetical protein